MHDRKCSISTLFISTSSIKIYPPTISTILLSDKHIVLLPAPVRPTTPTLCPASALKLRSSSTTCVSGLYYRVTSTNSIAPCVGHPGCNSLNVAFDMYPLMYSCGIFSMFKHLSALTILASTCIIIRIDDITNCCSVTEYERSIASMTE